MCFLFFFGTGGTGLEVCSPGPGSDVSVGLPAGISPGHRSPFHPSYLQMGQHHCSELREHTLKSEAQLTPKRGRAVPLQSTTVAAEIKLWISWTLMAEYMSQRQFLYDSSQYEKKITASDISAAFPPRSHINKSHFGLV